MNPALRQVYAEIPSSYERVNHVLTVGLDLIWRRRAARVAAAAGGRRWLDVCCGTGELGALLLRRLGPGGAVIGADGSIHMIRQARRKGGREGLVFTLTDASVLPFADGSFDGVAISFASRNVAVEPGRLEDALGEFHRVLRPGGSFIHLETSQPRSGWIRRLFHIYVGLVVRALGPWISGHRRGYRYLAASILRFHDPEALTGLLRSGGFTEVSHRSLLFGAVALHQAVRPA